MTEYGSAGSAAGSALGVATAISTNDVGAVTLDVSDATDLGTIGATITNGYNIADSASALVTEYGSTGSAAGSVLGDATAISTNDVGAADISLQDLTDLGTIGATITNGYRIADSASALVTEYGSAGSAAGSALGDATAISTNDVGAADISLQDLTDLGTIGATITNGYNIADSASALVTEYGSTGSAAGSALGDATAISTNDVGAVTLDVSDATDLGTIGATITNGYNIADSASALVTEYGSTGSAAGSVLGDATAISTNDVGAVTLDVSDATDLGAIGATITNGYNIADSASALVTEYGSTGSAAGSALGDATAISTNDVGAVTLDVSDATDLGTIGATITNGYNIADSASALVTEYGSTGSAAGSVLGDATAISTNDVGAVTLDVSDATDLGTIGATITNGYNIADSASALVTEYGSTGSAAGSALGDATAISTNDVGAVTLDVSDATDLGTIGATITNGYNIADSASALVTEYGSTGSAAGSVLGERSNH